MADLLSRILPPKPTDAELAEGKKARQSFRMQVDTRQTQIDQSQEAFTKLKIQHYASALQTSVKKASAWLQANIDVTKRQVDTEQTRFQEEFAKEMSSLISAVSVTLPHLTEADRKAVVSKISIPELKSAVQKANEKLFTKEQADAQKEQEELQNRGVTDDVKDAINVVLKIALLITVIVVALRLGSYAANTSLHLAPQYRILNFIYTVLLFPLFIFYYGFFILRNFFFPETYAPLRVESMLPIYPYPPDKAEITFTDRLFGYAETQEILQLIQLKQDDLEQRQMAALA